MTPQNSGHEHYSTLKATLDCGSVVEMIQRERNMIMEFTVTPPPGIPITDTAQIKDGVLRINMTVESVIGMFQLLGIIVTGGQNRKRKKFLGVF